MYRAPRRTPTNELFIGQTVYFWQPAQLKLQKSQQKWQGPGIIIGVWGHQSLIAYPPRAGGGGPPMGLCAPRLPDAFSPSSPRFVRMKVKNQALKWVGTKAKKNPGKKQGERAGLGAPAHPIKQKRLTGITCFLVRAARWWPS